MIELGHYNQLRVEEESPFGVYVGDGEDRVLLPRKFVTDKMTVGKKVRVFVYNDSEDRLVATTQSPRLTVGEFACLRAVDVTRIGAFLDWGLDKDLFIPFRRQRRRMRQGGLYVVTVCVDDRSNRLIGTSYLDDYLRPADPSLGAGDEVSLLPYDRCELGTMVVVEGAYSGLIFRSDAVEHVSLGTPRKGYIKQVRDDGKVDIVLRPQGYDGAMAAAPELLVMLRESGGFLPYNAKSSADRIQRVFKMSRKSFKKLIGGLYKEGVITVTEKGIQLNEET